MICHIGRDDIYKWGPGLFLLTQYMAEKRENPP